MLAATWFKGLFSRRIIRLAGTAGGVAVTVAFLVSLGSFMVASTTTMTQRAIRDVSVDWQIQLVPGTDPQTAVPLIAQTMPYTALETVGYASVSGFSATTAQTVQTTGAGKVVGLRATYQQAFPAQIRELAGTTQGVLVAQQTASNLHVTPGDTVTINRIGLTPVTVVVAGIVDLPLADSLFQVVGVPTSATPQAPPDNVVILPDSLWYQFFDPQMVRRPDTVQLQLHVKLNHTTLSSDPGTAFEQVQQLANKLQAWLAGTGSVGNNLAGRLDGVRTDALYVYVLFLFLGLPGVIVAIWLTLAVAACEKERRSSEQALLRIRGASTAQLLRLAGLEALVIGLSGVLAGIGLAYLLTGLLAGGINLNIWGWFIGSCVAGLLLAIGGWVVPLWQAAHWLTVATTTRGSVTGLSERPALWQRFYLDAILFVIAGLNLWQTASQGYQIVLAPEGVAQSSVDYTAFVAPVCFALAGVLLIIRIWRNLLTRPKLRYLLILLTSSFASRLKGIVASWLSRQQFRLIRGIVLVAITFAFATSTAIFNTTYNAQARIDAQLTNGADIAVTGSTAVPPSQLLPQLATLPDVAAIQPLQHRFAYVGNDLQDLYGINPAEIGQATPLSDAFFASGKAQEVLTTLANQPDGILVSEETVKDYQLTPGDELKLRLQNNQDHQYHTVSFHFIGIVREFPTAPKDSFLIANTSYISQMSGSSVAEIILIRASNNNSAQVAQSVRQLVRATPGIKVSDLNETQQMISSSLTAVDLSQLSALELSFAVFLIVGATGLVLGLGLVERKRAFAILTALGAKKGQLGYFVWAEGLVVVVGGGILGIVVGFGLAWILVKILTGVFDPPPEFVYIPWDYFGLLVIAALISTVVTITSFQAAARHEVTETLREL